MTSGGGCDHATKLKDWIVEVDRGQRCVEHYLCKPLVPSTHDAGEMTTENFLRKGGAAKIPRIGRVGVHVNTCKRSLVLLVQDSSVMRC
jgi:hypothetical protein